MEIIFLVIVLIFSVIIHEVAHGAVANYLGDPTAKHAGRLTLNPIKHIDPIGSIALPLLLIIMARFTGAGIIFGWAKPVPVNPYNFRDQKYGSAKVSIAGPGSNLAIALVFGMVLRFFPGLSVLPGIDIMFSYIVSINILLAVFNLLPIPPLDGSHILFAFLPRSMEKIKIFLSQAGFFLIILFIFFLSPVLSWIVRVIFDLIVGNNLSSL